MCEPRAKPLRNAAGRLEEDVEEEGTGGTAEVSVGDSGGEWAAV